MAATVGGAWSAGTSPLPLYPWESVCVGGVHFAYSLRLIVPNNVSLKSHVQSKFHLMTNEVSLKEYAKCTLTIQNTDK